MRCSQCGGDTTIAGGRCTACGALASTAFAATGLLTPPPEQRGLTQLPLDSAVTVVGPPSAAGGRPATASTPGLLAPGQAFGGRYQIIRVLGQGGMGCVYHAWDSELSVGVALKVIRPEINDDATVAAEIERRFKRELLLARQVSHKNVVRIHDLGDVDGTKYITMTYVEGSDLSAMLEREGKLSPSQVIQYARQIAAGLQAAHEVGVVHRDLKPANVMVDADGRALIMDFGIARSISSDSGVGTVLGTVVGTLDYMAPEQAQGQRADQRADIYAFGLILYDLLLGRRPAPRGESAVVALMARIKSAPRSPRSFDPAIPETLDAIVMKCLQPDPAARYQTSAELVAALDGIDDAGLPLPEKRLMRLPKMWLAAAALVIAVLVGTATWWVTRPPAAPVQRDPISVLIANFENGTGDPVFEGSLEQSLAIGIEGASFVTSYRRDLAQRVAETIKPGIGLGEDGAMLVAVREGVKVLLAGSVTGDSGGYQLSVRALDPAGSNVLFTASASASDKADVLKAVGTLASRVREQLGDTAAEGASATAETFTAGSLEAMRHYSQAQALSRGRDSEAIEQYRAATAQDPSFGRAYAGWAVSASRLGRRDEAAEQWKRALSLLDRMTEREKYRTLGGYAVDMTRDFEQAVEHYRTLVRLYPADEAGHSNLALAHFYLLDFANALEEGRRAVEIYPSDVRFRNNLALYAMYAGDFTTAAAEAKRVLEQDAAFHKAHLPIAAAAIAGGDFSGAERAYDNMARTGAPGASLAALGRADAALYRGRFDEAVEILAAGLAADEAAGNTSSLARKHVVVAEAHASNGRSADAVRAAQRAIELSDSEAVVVPAAGILIDIGRPQQAVPLAARLGERLSPHSRAYARLIEGRVALAQGKPVEAVEAFRTGLKLADVWLLRFNLGVAYVQAGQMHSAAALAELESCLKRQGEATAVFLDDVPTVRYLAPVHYWLGRAREGAGLKASAVESYKTFLLLRSEPSRDPLAADARRRLD